MRRVILAVILGLVAIWFINAVFAVLPVLAGTFHGRSRMAGDDVSAFWSIFGLAAAFVSAYVGGRVARSTADSATGPRALAAMLLILWTTMAVVALSRGLESTSVHAWLFAVSAGILLMVAGVLMGGRAVRADNENGKAAFP